jgi:hypothetical protein
MIKNPHTLEQFELEYERENPLSLEQRLDLFGWMYDLARDFGHFDPERNEDDDEDAIALAKILNEQVQTPAVKYRAGT